jgi:hypothetical protein
VTVAGDRIVSGTDHRIWFGGTTPCDEHGRPISCVNAEQHVVTADTRADFMLSSVRTELYTNHTPSARRVAVTATFWRTKWNFLGARSANRSLVYGKPLLVDLKFLK